MSQTEEELLASKKITSQIKRSRGQLDGILNMMEEGRPCDDVLVQLSAVKSGVDKAMKLVIAQNIRKSANCVDEQQLKDLQDSLDLMLKTKQEFLFYLREQELKHAILVLVPYGYFRYQLKITIFNFLYW